MKKFEIPFKKSLWNICFSKKSKTVALKSSEGFLIFYRNTIASKIDRCCEIYMTTALKY